MSISAVRRGRVSRDGYDRVVTLLPLRSAGPPTELRGAIDALLEHQRPEAPFVPNLPSVVEEMRPRAYTDPTTAAVAEPRPLADRRVVYGGGFLAERRASPGSRASSSFVGASRSPVRRRRAQMAPPSPAHRLSVSPTGRRSRVMQREAAGEVSAAERVRFRNVVTRKLMDLYDEAAELDDCGDNMQSQLTDAMRADPRRAREVGGSVQLAPGPTEEQRQALAAVAESLRVLRGACLELVATYLTPEEKRHLGVDTNLFQSRADRATKYQYSPAAQKRHRPSPAATAGTQQQRPASARPSERGGSSGPLAARSGTNTPDMAPARPPAPSPPSPSTPSAASSTQWAHAPRTPPADGPDRRWEHAGTAVPELPRDEEEEADQDDAAAQEEADVVEPAGAVTSPPRLPPSTFALNLSDTAAEGTPERRLAPGNASVSSLGGGAMSSGGQSPVRSGPPAGYKLVAPQPPSGGAGAHPAPDFLDAHALANAQALTHAPKGAPVKVLVKKKPLGDPAVHAVKQPPPPSLGGHNAISDLPSALSNNASAGTRSIAASAASRSHAAPSALLSAPPSMVHSKRTAPAVPTTRPEFQRFLVDSDSESFA